MNGAELFVDELKQRGVTSVAVLCGHGLDPFSDACLEAGMRLVDVRNEQSAGYMAEAMGRLTRRVGVCAASSGVAHANALTGLLNAKFDGAPVLLVTGSGSTETMGLGHFQDVDQVAMAEPICKFARIVDRPERIPQLVHQAFTTALSGRPGPVHLTLPLNVQTAEVDPGCGGRAPRSQLSTVLPSAAAPGQVAQAVDLLSKAERPLLIAGSGVYYAAAEEALADFASSHTIPIVVPIWDRGAIPLALNAFMGVIGAATGGPSLLPDADLIIVAGAACDYRVGYLKPPAIREDALIIRIDSDPDRLAQGVDAHLLIPGDPCTVLGQLSENTTAPPARSWFQEAARRRDAFREGILVARPSDAPTHPLDIVNAVKSVLTDDTVVLIDGGNIGQWAHHVVCERYPGHWLTCGASAVVGYGLPAAMAARLVYPDRPIVLISGDGSLTFTVAELECAARQKLGFVVLLADDQAWGIALSGHLQRFGRSLAGELGPIRFDQMAESFGARGLRVESPGGIEPALREGLVITDRPTLLHVPVVRSDPSGQS
ncbi:MAG: thiamine pyrophosphate-binding protein [Candidatus Latescibacteria bacterium]|nr:thiamine pyrophosphate-binding protein [Candidatus Latescibacterota bacterium]